MVDINDYNEERSCVYKDEEYLVRDNGAVLRKSRPNKKERKNDNRWTFGEKNETNGYSFFFGSNHRIHQIVATAFHGEPPTKEHIVDHIDTNRQNNRPNNLRWITKLENVVLNEVTRKKIEYRIGASIYEFLENPSKYRDSLGTPDFSWMRAVTHEEGKACLDNVKRWGGVRSKSGSSNAKIGDWIYQSQEEKNERITNSLNLLAKQVNWKTPMDFIRCPETITDNPIKSYLEKMSIGVTFAENQYNKAKILKFSSMDNSAIFVITVIYSSVKPFGVVKITYENGYYLHTSLGTFFSEEGAEKEFILAQGLEWNGDDSIDDYC